MQIANIQTDIFVETKPLLDTVPITIFKATVNENNKNKSN